VAGAYILAGTDFTPRGQFDQVGHRTLGDKRGLSQCPRFERSSAAAQVGNIAAPAQVCSTSWNSTSSMPSAKTALSGVLLSFAKFKRIAASKRKGLWSAAR